MCILGASFAHPLCLLCACLVPSLVPPWCLRDASVVPPWCLLGASLVPPWCLRDASVMFRPRRNTGVFSVTLLPKRRFFPSTFTVQDNSNSAMQQKPLRIITALVWPSCTSIPLSRRVRHCFLRCSLLLPVANAISNKIWKRSFVAQPLESMLISNALFGLQPSVIQIFAPIQNTCPVRENFVCCPIAVAVFDVVFTVIVQPSFAPVTSCHPCLN